MHTPISIISMSLWAKKLIVSKCCTLILMMSIMYDHVGLQVESTIRTFLGEGRGRRTTHEASPDILHECP